MTRPTRPKKVVMSSMASVAESSSAPAAQSSKKLVLAPNALPQMKGRGFRRGNMIGANFTIAMEALWANKLRSLLTSLGIFIGVAAVIAALTLTQGVGAFINGNISSLGTNVITISPGSSNTRGAFGGSGTTQSLTPADAASLTKIRHITGVSPIISVNAQVVYGNQNWNTRVQGVNTSYQSIQGWDIAEGTWFSTTDDRAGRAVTLLGQTVAHSLFDASGIDPVGQTIRIRDQLYRVIGVLAAKGGSFNQDDVVFIPFTTSLTRLKNSNYVDQIEIQVDDASNVNQVQTDLTTILERLHRIPSGSPDDFRAVSSSQLLQTAQQFSQTLTVLLVGIAAISLTVGGIGIMNIMIVSVTERTREIGIRMSIGARRADIRNQFLIEALVLSLIGGVIGMLIGFLLGFVITKVTGLPFVISLTSVLLPFLVSAAIGVTFGLYPAIRASRLDPIVALRTD
ncbi:MAG: ABC transporter permease [Ktedonobacteraceae bacterium]